METIALYGGSFDPPHIAHEALVKALLKIKEIDKVIVMPTYLNPFKSHSFAPSELRLKWLREIFSDTKKVEVSDYEVMQNKKVATIQSVKHLLKSYKKVFLVIGADNLVTLHKWENFDELESLVSFIVASRNNIDIPDGYIRLNIDIDVSSTMLRQDLDTKKLPQKCADEIKTFYQGNRLQPRIDKIVHTLDKNKAESIEVFDLREKNYFVEYAIIASSLGTKHTTALLNHLRTDLKPAENFVHVDESEDWVVIDLGDILIHIMTPEYRVKYDMESFLTSLSNGKEGDAIE